MTGIGTDRFKIGPLKMLGDGALGARTAFLSRPYADDPSTCGIPVFTQETMDEMIGYANAHGMQAAVHTIGDACLDRVLSAYEKALAETREKITATASCTARSQEPISLKKSRKCIFTFTHRASSSITITIS